MPPAGYFLRAQKVPKDAQETGWFLDFLPGRQVEFSVGHGLSVELSLRWRLRSGRESADTAVLAETILHFMPLARNLQTCGTHPNNLKRAGRAKGFLNRRVKRCFWLLFSLLRKVTRRRPLSHKERHRPAGLCLSSVLADRFAQRVRQTRIVRQPQPLAAHRRLESAALHDLS